MSRGRRLRPTACRKEFTHLLHHGFDVREIANHPAQRRVMRGHRVPAFRRCLEDSVIRDLVQRLSCVAHWLQPLRK